MQLFAADLEQQINVLTTNVTLWSAAILVIATIIAALVKNKVPKLKLPLFLIMTFTLVGSTLFLMASTVGLNVKSESGGPVHWHTDIELWACGTELELRDPTGLLSNKIGTSTYHEHNDKRIHLEGVVVRKAEDASLEKFMRVADGYMTDNSLGLALNEDSATWFAQGDKTDGDRQSFAAADQLKTYVQQSDKGPVIELANGKACGDVPAEVQTFVYRYDEESKTYSQTKLESGKDYIMRDESQVPSGDCVIVEFDRPKQRTNKLCEQYGVRDSERCREFGVEEYSPELCNITQVTSGGDF